MKYELKLTVDRDEPSPTIIVEDLSTPDTPPVQLAFGPHAELPLPLAIHESPTGPGQLTIRPNEPFDPQITRDSNVLRVEASVSDQRFGTQDDTKYILHIKNQSGYYLAEDIHVRAVLAEEAQAGPQDGNPALSLSPREQHIQCISPGESKDLVFVAISRGPAPGLYSVIVTIDYRLLYWDGRRARDTSKHLLPVEGDDLHDAFPSSIHGVPLPRQPKTQTRNRTMAQDQELKVFFAPLSEKAHHHHHLVPIEQHFDLPGGGHLGVSYRLLKGHHKDGGHGSCSYGRHPHTHDIESYFSTQDTASLELILHNESPHHLKHLHVANIRLMSVNPETKSIGGEAEARLPDGNLLFEILPSEAYFGHLGPKKKETRFLSLITRGVAPGHYAIQLVVHYDIEQCHLPINLWLTVRPD